MSNPKRTVETVSARVSGTLDTSGRPYFSRTLSSLDDADRTAIKDFELLALQRSVVILGEPGMGKSEMIRYLGASAGVVTVSATRFMHSKNPQAFVPPGQPLLIDALDEALVRSEGDAVDKVLANLEAAGYPRFILSCRAREWQSRTQTSLKEIYGVSPLVVSIEALTRAQAREFWATRGFLNDAEPVLARMDEQNLSDLYRNPLTLTLLGAVADNGGSLPATRAGLFNSVCELSWPENDEGRHGAPLARLSRERALSAAGALMASLIFAGAEAISFQGSGLAQDGDIPIPEIEALPAAGDARAVISSKLFKTVGANRVGPIHRVVAEFLGARWLAQEATMPRARKRLLSQFHGAGAVPSSLRGLHAWLAFHSSALAASVIEADPFGLLRYGESCALDPSLACTLFDALEALTVRDPFFRAHDWDARTALGLAQPSLLPRIESTLDNPESNAHLRSLLLESIKGSALVEPLGDVLQRIVLAAERGFSERYLAIKNLLPLRDRAYWRASVEALLLERSDDGVRLCRLLAGHIEYDLSDDLLAKILLVELDLLPESPTSASSPTLPTTSTATATASSRRRQRPIRIHSFEDLVKALSASRAKSLLRQLVMQVAPTKRGQEAIDRDFSQLVFLLLERALRGSQLSNRDVPALWRWLKAASGGDHAVKRPARTLASEMLQRDALRHAVQRYGIWRQQRRQPLWYAESKLRDRSVSVAAKAEDVAFFLKEIAARTRASRRTLQDWRTLVDLSVRPGADNALVVRAALAFPRLSNQQRAHLHALQRPRKFAWQIESEANAVERSKTLIDQRKQAIQHYEARTTAIREGELQSVLEPARVYLGLTMWDIDAHEMPPKQRLNAFFNEQLAGDLLMGFEAALHRPDLPSISDLAASYSEGTTYNYAFAIIAGLLARHKSARAFDGLPASTMRAGLLLCMQQRHMFGRDECLDALRRSLEHAVIVSDADRKQLIRTWIEPLLSSCHQAELDIAFIAKSRDWLPTGASLARAWLARFRDCPVHVEMEIVGLLAKTGANSQIIDATRERDLAPFRDEEQALAWLAIDVVYRFGEVREHLANIAQDNPEFLWLLRDRIQSDKFKAALDIAPQLAQWIVAEFRVRYPMVSLHGSAAGSTNGFDAAEFLQRLIALLANDTGDDSTALLHALADAPADTYTNEILHRMAGQRQKRSEESFQLLSPPALSAILTDGPPTNIDDLRSVIIGELQEAQLKLLGDELDQVRDFWGDDGVPYDENRCRDRVAALMDTRLTDLYGIKRMTEADMPKDKRADLAFSVGPTMQLPIEVKGQWHKDVWDAASDQLEAQYLVDWRSEGRGIFCVFWFGDVPSASQRRLKPHPDALPAPATSAEMRAMLVQRIPPARRPFIDVIVLDLRTGRK